MAVYNKSGTLLSSTYDVDGTVLPSAYDVEGNPLSFTLKIMTYNVGGWYIGSGTNVPAADDQAYYNLQNKIISDNDADILCIEEYWNTFSQAGRTAESLLSQYYDYIHTAKGNTQYMGRCICSKFPITNYVENYFSVDTSRYFDCATINVNGENIVVFITLLSPSNAEYRVTQATQIRTYIQNNNLTNYIVCGDFNSKLYNPFSEENADIYQQFINDGCAIANGGVFGLFNTHSSTSDWNDAKGLDNIISSGVFTIESVETDLTKTTDDIDEKIDHVPLYAVIKAVIQ